MTTNNRSEQDYRRGIKSGVFAGLIYGGLFTLLLILLLVFLPIPPQMRTQFLESGIGGKGFYALYFVFIPLILIGFSAVAGLVYGVCFAWLINKLPSQNLWIKSITLGIIFWLIIPIPFGMLLVLGNPDKSLGMVIYSALLYVVFSGIFALIYRKLKTISSTPKKVQ